ncbi:MAG TPA: ABC transporter permease [Deltaproteobacteria bacterium]|nr:ABC transporter permease [Deltaproteobacteria bacterium]
MNLRRLRAVSRKEFIQIARDPRSLGMAIAIPMLLLLLFGYALTLDVDNVPLVVWDQDGTHESREFISRFTGSPYFSLYRYVENYRDIESAVDAGKALAGLVIPRGFAGRTGSGRKADVQLILDGSDSNTATLAAGYAEAVTLIYSQETVAANFRCLGGVEPLPPLDVRTRVWYNPDLDSKNYIIPGLIAVIMSIIAALLTSLTVAREWERGTMEQLISTPVKVPELVLGKLIPYFTIGLFDVLMAVLMGEFLFQVPLRGNVALLFVMAAVFLSGALSLGMLISIVTKNQLLASQVAIVSTFLPSFLLSGFMYPISTMPQVVQSITYIIPARYFVALLKGIYLKGVGLDILFFEAGLLLLFGCVIVITANVKFRKLLE